MATRLPTMQRLILAMALLDGGVVELSGIDARSWMTKAHRNAAAKLGAAGLGEYLPEFTRMPGMYARFTINEAGRTALQ